MSGRTQDFHGGQPQAVHKGAGLRCQPATLPPLDAYERHAATKPGTNRRDQPSQTGGKLRRAVLMRRNGCGYNEIGRAIGCTGSTVSRWLGELPEELKP